MQFDANGLPILDQFSEEGFVDLIFRITDFKDDDQRYRFHLTASHDGNEVGFNVEMLKGIQGGIREDENEELQLVQEHVYSEGVEFFRSGVDSDALVSVMADLYGLASDDLQMIESHTFTAIALHEGTLDFDSEFVNIKLFANDKEECPEEDYFECFFNVDFANELAYWNEKDQDYREPLIRGLASATL
jgi:hypothetical protein